MNSRRVAVMVVVALGCAGMGWSLRGAMAGGGGPGGLLWPEAADHGNWQVQPVSSGADGGRKRPERTAKGTPDKPAMRMHMDGSITVPAGLTDRIRVNVMDLEGRISRDELALFGISGETVNKLQTLADEVRAAENERQAKHVKILRDEDGVTVLMVPPGDAGGKSGEARRNEAQARLDGIVGRDHPLVAEALRSHFSSISNSWQEETLIVDTRLTKSGQREYRVYSYPEVDGDALPEDMLDPDVLMRSSSGLHTYYSDEVPEDLRHLFK